LKEARPWRKEGREISQLQNDGKFHRVGPGGVKCGISRAEGAHGGKKENKGHDQQPEDGPHIVVKSFALCLFEKGFGGGRQKVRGKRIPESSPSRGREGCREMLQHHQSKKGVPKLEKKW